MLLALSVGVPGVMAQAPAPAGAGHGTRTSATFAELEDGLLQALRGHRTAELEALLDDDFLMTVAQDPDQPVSRPDWLAASRKAGSGDWALSHLVAREYGSVTVASFRLQPMPAHSSQAPLFVVDTWQRQAAGWRLMARLVAPAVGPRRGIPGDAPAEPIRKK